MFWKGIHKFNRIEVAPGGAAYGFGEHVNSYRRVYYVNNITGSSANLGTSWDKAMDEISTAVTASEVHRKDRGSVTTNDYIRNVIVVQGTGTPYTKLTTLPLFTDFIGLGADVRGSGTGIVSVGEWTSRSYALLTTDTIRGLNMYNIQFQGGNDVAGSVAIMKLTNIFRSRWEDCAIMTTGVPTASPAYGLRLIGSVGGLHLVNVFWGNQASYDGIANIGMSIEGTTFHNSVVEGCHIAGVAAAVKIASGCVNGWGSEFKDNYIGGDGSVIATIGVDDDSTTGTIHFSRNSIGATAPLDLENDGTGRANGDTALAAFVTNA